MYRTTFDCFHDRRHRAAENGAGPTMSYRAGSFTGNATLAEAPPVRVWPGTKAPLPASDAIIAVGMAIFEATLAAAIAAEVKHAAEWLDRTILWAHSAPAPSFGPRVMGGRQGSAI
jgi:hypothetical protein